MVRLIDQMQEKPSRPLEEGGGNNQPRASVQARRGNRSTTKSVVNGTVFTTRPASEVRVATWETIPDVQIVKLGKLLSVLAQGAVSDEFFRDALSGTLLATDALLMLGANFDTLIESIEAGGLAADATDAKLAKLREKITKFLLTRGFSFGDANRIIGKLPEAWSLPNTSEMSDREAADTEAREAADELTDSVERGDTVESWQDEKKKKEAVENESLIELGETLAYLFPYEFTDHMGIYRRVINDIAGLCSSDPHKYPALNRLAEWFNFMRGDQTHVRGDANNAIANGAQWDDPDVTTEVLTAGVVEASSIGRYDLAAVLLGLSNIGTVKTLRSGRKVNAKRSKALYALSYVSRTDAATYAVQRNSESGALTYSATPVKFSATGSERAIRSSLAHSLVSIGAFDCTSVSQFQNLLQPMERALLFRADDLKYPNKIRERLFALLGDREEIYFEFYSNLLSYLTGKQSSRIDDNPDGPDDFNGKPSDFVMNADTVPSKNAAAHKLIVDFAQVFTERMGVVADAIDLFLGETGNEVTVALRNGELTSLVVQEIEDTIDQVYAENIDDKEKRDKIVSKIARWGWASVYRESLISSYTNDAGIETYFTCKLISDLVFYPMTTVLHEIAAYREALDAAGRAGFQEYLADVVYNSGITAGLARSGVRANIGARFFDGTPKTADKRLIYAQPGSDRSVLSRFFAAYHRTLPRANARASASRQPGSRGAGTVVTLPASAMIAQLRLEDTLLNAPRLKSLRENYFTNGSKFYDGSRMVVLAAGATFGRNLEPSDETTRIVHETNLNTFVRGDTRNVKFQLFHGEKTTAASIQLPGGVCTIIYEDILAGEAYTVNAVTRDEQFLARLPRKDGGFDSLDMVSGISDVSKRRLVYQAIYSVVASCAKCDEISPKRTQVLLAQGVLFSGYRDKYMEKTDGGLVERSWKEVVNVKTGEPVRPATNYAISISGKSGTSDMGMFFIHGRLVEAQRAISTNPDAVSFKNHLNGVTGAFLTKGQGHAIGIGMEANPIKLILGTHRHAQAMQRRFAEKLLGIDGDAAAPLTEEQKLDPKAVAEHEDAVKRVNQFFEFSSTVYTDGETLKVGLFGAGAGFAADSKDAAISMKFSAGGKEYAVTVDFAGNRISEDGGETWTEMSTDTPDPEYKDGAWKLLTAMPRILETLKVTEMTAEEVAAMTAKWRAPNGAVTEGTIGDTSLVLSYGSFGSDALAFSKEEAGSGNGKSMWHAFYSTRDVVGQIMANNDASAKPTNEPPAATNYVRDQAANQPFRRGGVDPYTSVPAIVTVGRLLPMVATIVHPELAEYAVTRDPDFALSKLLFPDSDWVREQTGFKLAASIGRSMRVHPGATHAVMLGSGIMASLNKIAHDADYDTGGAVTEWDVDALRPAEVFSAEKTRVYRELYGNRFAMDRGYASGLANVVGAPGFRYGWYLDTDAAMKARDEFIRMGDGDGTKARAFTRLNDQIAEFEGKYLLLLRQTTDANVKECLLMAWAAAIIRSRHPALHNIISRIFRDYTGKFLAESASSGRIRVDDSAFSDDLPPFPLDDLLIFNEETGAEEFDFVAVDMGSRKRLNKAWDGKEVGVKRAYVGGSFFSADHKPSCNFEGSSGLCRAVAPVCTEPDGTPMDVAMYVLDPVLARRQAASAGGNTANLIVSSGHIASDGRQIENLVRDMMKALEEMETRGEINFTDARLVALWDRLMGNENYKRFFRTRKVDIHGEKKEVTELSGEFVRQLGDLLFQAQVDNYRMIETREQSPEPGERAKTAGELSENGRMLDVGFSGRDPVGPEVVGAGVLVPADDASTRSIYKSVVGKDMPDGMTYHKAFVECVNAITRKAGVLGEKLNLLGAEVSAFLTTGGVNSSLSRGVGVALQAAIEHLTAYAANDPKLQKLAPRFYVPVVDADGNIVYDGVREFVARMNAISNSLFDVMKDLFAPRAGWQRDLLDYMVARLVYDANFETQFGKNGERLSDSEVRFNDSWFFARLVNFARDFHESPTSIPCLLKLSNARNNYLQNEKYGTYGLTLTFRGLIMDRAFKESGETNLLKFLAGTLVSEFTVSWDYGIRVVKFNKAQPFLDRLKTMDGGGQNDFVWQFKKWSRDLARAIKDCSPYHRSGAKVLGSDPVSRLAVLVGKQLESETKNEFVPEFIMTGIRRHLEQLKQTSPDRATPYFASAKLLDEFAAMLNPGDPVIACHALLASGHEFWDSVDRVRTAFRSLDAFNRIKAVNTALSPEPAFQKGGARIDRYLVAHREAKRHISSDNVAAMVQMAASYAYITRMLQNGLDRDRLSKDVAKDWDYLRKFVFNSATINIALPQYNLYVESRNVEPLIVDRTLASPFRTIDLQLYVAAAMRSNPSTWNARPTAADIDLNRRCLGAVMYAMVAGMHANLVPTLVDNEGILDKEIALLDSNPDIGSMEVLFHGAEHPLRPMVADAMKRRFNALLDEFLIPFTVNETVQIQREKEIVEQFRKDENRFKPKESDEGSDEYFDAEYEEAYSEPEDYDEMSLEEEYSDRRRVAPSTQSILGREISRFLQTSTVDPGEHDPEVVFLFQHLAVNEYDGRVSLSSKLTPEQCRIMLNGMQKLLKDTGAVLDHNGDVAKFGDERYTMRYSDIGALLMIHLAATQPFDPANEQRAQPDISILFPDDAKRMIGRFGRALEKTFVGRALMRVPRSYGAYDVMRLPRNNDTAGFNVYCMFDIIGHKFPGAIFNFEDACNRVLNYGRSLESTPGTILYELFARKGTSFRAALRRLESERGSGSEIENAVSNAEAWYNEFAATYEDAISPYTEDNRQTTAGELLDSLIRLRPGIYVPEWMGNFGFAVNGQNFQTIEDAVNSLVSEHAATVYNGAEQEGVEAQVFASLDYAIDAFGQNQNTPASVRDLTGKILNETYNAILAKRSGTAYRFLLWVESVVGGRQKLPPTTHPGIAEGFSRFYTEKAKDILHPAETAEGAGDTLEAPRASVVSREGNLVIPVAESGYVAEYERGTFGEWLRRAREGNLSDTGSTGASGVRDNTGGRRGGA